VGGFGSGRLPGGSGRHTTDDLPALDVRELKRAGLIDPGQERVENVARLAWTPCGIGGARPWFVCPGEGCGRRAAILYLEDGAFLCRLCRDLAYASQREGRLGGRLPRARRRAEKARARLGPDTDPKPKGMHHRTFVRLGREYVEAYWEHVACYNEWAAKVSEWYSRRPPGSPR
jgi:hypothetical protein